MWGQPPRLSGGPGVSGRWRFPAGSLLPPRMRFRALCKEVIRPRFLLHGQLWCCSRSRFGLRRDRILFGSDVPIFRRISDSPHVSGIVERGANQKIPAILAQRQTVRHPRGYGGSPRQVSDHDRRLKLHRTRTAKPAALRAHHQQHAALRKRTHPVEASDTDRNLHADPSAAPRCLRSVNVHHGIFFGLPGAGS